MKIFTYIAIAIALGLIVFNTYKFDFSNPFEGESTIAIIGIIAAFCAILLLIITALFKKLIIDKTNRVINV
jgi:hypothetical protein